MQTMSETEEEKVFADGCIYELNYQRSIVQKQIFLMPGVVKKTGGLMFWSQVNIYCCISKESKIK